MYEYYVKAEKKCDTQLRHVTHLNIDFMAEELKQSNGIGTNLKRREFPKLYQKSGDVDVDKLQFFHVLERLKVQANHITTSKAN